MPLTGHSSGGVGAGAPAAGDGGQQPAKKVPSMTFRQSYERYFAKKMALQGVEIGKPVMPQRDQVGVGHEGDIEIETNAFAIMMQYMTVYRYDVDITGVKPSGRVIVLTKKFKDDAIAVDRRECCRDAFELFRRQHPEYVEHAKCFYNDLQSILYTLAPICPLKKEEKPVPILEEFDVSNVQRGSLQGHRFDKINILLTPVLESIGSAAESDQFGFGIPLGDLGFLTPDLSLANRELQQFLDIATSQMVFFHTDENGAYEHVHFSSGTSYMYEPQNFEFLESDVAEFKENRSYLGLGCQKSTHMMEGPRNISTSGRMPTLLVQPKRTPFHLNCPLLEKVNAICEGLDGRPEWMTTVLSKQLKGLYVDTTHNKERTQRFPIKGFDSRGAFVEFEPDGDGSGAVTVQQYFRDRYHMELQYPQLPVVVTDMTFGDKKRKNYFPMEVLHVVDNQRVTSIQQSPGMISQAIKKCAIPPAILRRQVRQTAMSIHLWDSPYLEAANIVLTDEPIVARGHRLEHPAVKTGFPNPERPQMDSASWRINKVLISQQVLGGDYKWGVACFQHHPESRAALQLEDLNAFIEMFEKQARSRNINLPRISWEPDLLDVTLNAIRDHFELAAADGVAFLLCVHVDSDDLTHHTIKKFEREFGIITQCVKVGTIRNVLRKNQRLTVDNILNKTNVKLGGLNYTLPNSQIGSDMTTLVIGISSNHPGGGLGERTERPSARTAAASAEKKIETAAEKKVETAAEKKAGTSAEKKAGTSGEKKAGDGEGPELMSDTDAICVGPPTVVGYAANVGPTKLPFDFIGDFVYQHAQREERVNIIEDIVGKCIRYFKQARGSLPEYVVIYRNGCNEGQFPLVLKYEIPLIKRTLENHGCKRDCLTVIASNKLQNVRFFDPQADVAAKPPEQNIKPGTTVDTTVVHPIFCEFFLNSHRTLQGTARTPKYTLLHDDTGMSLMDLEEMTYHLCFGHQIINSPVSLPAPVFIASEYAKRGRNLYNQHDKPQGKPTTYKTLNHALCLEHAGWIGEYRINA